MPVANSSVYYIMDGKFECSLGEGLVELPEYVSLEDGEKIPVPSVMPDPNQYIGSIYRGQSVYNLLIDSYYISNYLDRFWMMWVEYIDDYDDKQSQLPICFCRSHEVRPIEAAKALLDASLNIYGSAYYFWTDLQQGDYDPVRVYDAGALNEELLKIILQKAIEEGAKRNKYWQNH